MQLAKQFFRSITGVRSPDSRSSVSVAHAKQMLASLLTMAWFVEARDPYTGGHLWRVSRYAYLLARQAGFDAAYAAKVGLGAFLHDVGKVGVPDDILRKPSRLTEAEFSVIKTHPALGRRMISGHPLSGLIQDAVYSHHERPDGHGYPLGLKGEEIPLMARIVGICDAFDAMTSHRPYRRGMPKDDALSILQSARGSQFDDLLVGHFLTLGQKGELEHVIGHSDDGIPLQSCPMCGPTLVVQREYRANKVIFCRSCSGQFTLLPSGEGLKAEPTGLMGTAMDLLPTLDNELIRRTVAQAAEVLSTHDLLNEVSLDESESGSGH